MYMWGAPYHVNARNTIAIAFSPYVRYFIIVRIVIHTISHVGRCEKPVLLADVLATFCVHTHNTQPWRHKRHSSVPHLRMHHITTPRQ